MNHESTKDMKDTKKLFVFFKTFVFSRFIISYQ